MSSEERAVCGASIRNVEIKIPNCAAGFCGVSGLYVRVAVIKL